MDIIVTKRDILWSYLAKFFSVGTGVITLPAILKLLSADEIGINYILLSINSMIALFDMGFSSQFSRYLTYIFSGAQSIKKEGVTLDYSDHVNGKLLAITIRTAKTIYFYLSSLALILMLTIGTYYIYTVTNSFTLVDNIHIIWLLFCGSTYFNLYFLYLNSFLQGRGLVKETNQAQVLSRIIQLLLLLILIMEGFGLLGVVIANFIAPFVFRLIAYKKFYTKETCLLMQDVIVSYDDIKETFKILFYNAKKIGIIAAFASLLGYASTLIIAMFLPLPIVGSYGVLAQIVGIIGTIALTFLTSKMPQLSYLIVTRNECALKKEFGMGMFVFYCIYISGLLILSFFPYLFSFFHFSVSLPAYGIVMLYGFTRFVEQNQSAYCQLLIAQNKLLYFKSSIITCVLEFALLVLLLKMGIGLLGVVLAQAIPLFAYCAWKWPIFVCRSFDIGIIQDIMVNPLYKLLYNR